MLDGTMGGFGEYGSTWMVDVYRCEMVQTASYDILSACVDGWTEVGGPWTVCRGNVQLLSIGERSEGGASEPTI